MTLSVSALAATVICQPVEERFFNRFFVSPARPKAGVLTICLPPWTQRIRKTLPSLSLLPSPDQKSEFDCFRGLVVRLDEWQDTVDAVETSSDAFGTASGIITRAAHRPFIALQRTFLV